MNVVLRSASVLALFAAALAASAAPLTYTLSSTATGVLDGVSFTNASVVVTGTGDPSGAPTSGNATYVALTSTSVSVAGASDTFTGVMTALSAVTNTGYFTIFNGIPSTGGPSVLGLSNAAIKADSVLQPFGPLSGPVYNPLNVSFATQRGSFILSAAGTATVVVAPVSTPEPSALAALGLGAVAVLRRRKRA